MCQILPRGEHRQRWLSRPRPALAVGAVQVHVHRHGGAFWPQIATAGRSSAYHGGRLGQRGVQHGRAFGASQPSDRMDSLTVVREVSRSAQVDANGQQISTERSYNCAVGPRQLAQPSSCVVAGHQVSGAGVPPTTNAQPNMVVHLDVADVLGFLAELGNEPEGVAASAAADRRDPRLTTLTSRCFEQGLNRQPTQDRVTDIPLPCRYHTVLQVSELGHALNLPKSQFDCRPTEVSAMWLQVSDHRATCAPS